MAALTNIQMFTWIGISVAGARNAIIGDFLSDGLEGLEHMSDEEVKDTCSSYAKRADGPFPVILSPVHKQRMKSLVLWVKDMKRGQWEPTFANTTTKAQFLQALNESLARDRRRREQKKVGESFHDHTFNNKLKSQSQWEKFMDELESTLSMIIGARGVQLTYVIREKDTPAYDASKSYDDVITDAISLQGEEYKIDAQIVHQLILNNVLEDSDAYTYIKTLMRKRDGRRDIIALRERYSSDATKQAIINTAKAALENLRYKTERSFSKAFSLALLLWISVLS